MVRGWLSKVINFPQATDEFSRQLTYDLLSGLNCGGTANTVCKKNAYSDPPKSKKTLIKEK
jgi:hypothetical protein